MTAESTSTFRQEVVPLAGFNGGLHKTASILVWAGRPEPAHRF